MEPKKFTAFLSCSLRPGDEHWADYVRREILGRNDIEAHTVGVNVSGPKPSLDLMRQWISQCDCVVAVATTRFLGTDVARPNEEVRLLPYAVDEELLMGWISGKPLVVFKDKRLAVTGFLSHQKTTWIDFEPEDPHTFKRARTFGLVISMLRHLLVMIEENRRRAFFERLKDIGIKVAAGLGLGALALRLFGGADGVPDCYGLHDGRTTVCQHCPWRTQCRKEKRGAE